MQRLFTSFLEYAVVASDRTAGRVCDVFFDDKLWDIRHVVVDTGGWLSGRKVLLNPSALTTFEDRNKVLRIRASRRQVRTHPPITADPPVSLQARLSAQEHFRWIGMEAAAPGAVPPFSPSALEEEDDAITDHRRARRVNPRLRSAREVIRYRVENARRQIGQIEDFIFDDVTWQVDFLVVYVTALTPARRLLLRTGDVPLIRRDKMTVRTGLTVAALRNCPPFRGAPGV
ncbi:MAG TPA: PRC-barrel domain-containing protein [Bacteroidota bacterium]|nr:PRC-barrel domain-containing protein [Bacteroidota bacterium]